MLYFVPAWYDGDKWKESEEYWYRKKARSEFDETIKQIQLIHRNRMAPYEILLLSHAPNFRHFLHRQGLFRANYWSCFDCIQQIKRKKIATLSYHSLKWPEGVEFIYSPFTINAFLNGKRYAEVEFGENGNPISVILYEGEQICRVNEYDDRGFLSATTVYENGRPHHKDYLMEDGIWKMRESLPDGRIQINPRTPGFTVVVGGSTKEVTFSSLEYADIRNVIREVFYANMDSCKVQDIFIVAAHRLHMHMLTELLKNRQVIMTFFENRFTDADLLQYREELQGSDYLITDAKDTAETIRQRLGMSRDTVFDISPYDTRVDFGISQQMKVQNVLVPVDGVAEQTFEKLILYVAGYLQKNEKARVQFFTRNADYSFREQIMQRTENLLMKYGFDRRWISGQTPLALGENRVDAMEEETVELRFFFQQAVDERSISKCIHEQRVILDVRNTTDVFLFVTAISKGVPRITVCQDQYLEHLRNGYVMKSLDETGDALAYYLDSLDNWNEALVGCYEMGQVYTTKNLIEAWKGVLDSFE